VGIVVLVVLVAGAAQAFAGAQATSTVTATAKSQRVGESTDIWTVSGKVGSPNAACKSSRKVKVEFLYPKPPFVHVQTKTAKDGTFTATLHLNALGEEQPTELKVTALKSTASGVTCKEATKSVPLS
jgi:hypothetical protein